MPSACSVLAADAHVLCQQEQGAVQKRNKVLEGLAQAHAKQQLVVRLDAGAMSAQQRVLLGELAQFVALLEGGSCCSVESLACWTLGQYLDIVIPVRSCPVWCARAAKCQSVYVPVCMLGCNAELSSTAALAATLLPAARVKLLRTMTAFELPAASACACQTLTGRLLAALRGAAALAAAQGWPRLHAVSQAAGGARQCQGALDCRLLEVFMRLSAPGCQCMVPVFCNSCSSAPCMHPHARTAAAHSQLQLRHSIPAPESAFTAPLASPESESGSCAEGAGAAQSPVQLSAPRAVRLEHPGSC